MHASHHMSSIWSVTKPCNIHHLLSCIAFFEYKHFIPDIFLGDRHQLSPQIYPPATFPVFSPREFLELHRRPQAVKGGVEDSHGFVGLQWIPICRNHCLTWIAWMAHNVHSCRFHMGGHMLFFYIVEAWNPTKSALPWTKEAKRLHAANWWNCIKLYRIFTAI